METYIGVKEVRAVPGVRVRQTNAYGKEEWVVMKKSHAVLRDGFEAEDGYIVEYPDGYRSFSPKDVFEKAYMKKAELRDKFAKNPELYIEHPGPDVFRVTATCSLVTGDFLSQFRDVRPFEHVAKGEEVPPFAPIFEKDKKDIEEQLDIFFKLLESWAENGIKR